MDDDLVFAEDDLGWFVGLERTVYGAFFSAIGRPAILDQAAAWRPSGIL